MLGSIEACFQVQRLQVATTTVGRLPNVLAQLLPRAIERRRSRRRPKLGSLLQRQLDRARVTALRES